MSKSELICIQAHEEMKNSDFVTVKVGEGYLYLMHMLFKNGYG
jgi:hypothetical protein